MMLKKFLRRKKSDVQSIEELTQPLEVTHELQHAVFTLFNNNPSQTYNAKQVMRSAKDMDMVLSRELCDMILSKLQSELVIEADKDKKGGYRLTRTLLRMATGKVDMTSSGMAYI
ncbi:MAG: hypothetical protein RR652_03745, partial [Mucinivorans sp.]